MLRLIGTMLPDTWRSMSGRLGPAGGAMSNQYNDQCLVARHGRARPTESFEQPQSQAQDWVMEHGFLAQHRAKCVGRRRGTERHVVHWPYTCQCPDSIAFRNCQCTAILLGV